MVDGRSGNHAVRGYEECFPFSVITKNVTEHEKAVAFQHVPDAFGSLMNNVRLGDIEAVNDCNAQAYWICKFSPADYGTVYVRPVPSDTGALS